MPGDGWITGTSGGGCTHVPGAQGGCCRGVRGTSGAPLHSCPGQLGKGLPGAVRCRHRAWLHGSPGHLARRVLLHGCAGPMRGFATWISWGNLNDVLLYVFLEVLLGG